MGGGGRSAARGAGARRALECRPSAASFLSSLPTSAGLGAMIRRAKPEAERDVSSVRAAASSRREKSLKGFLIVKLYFGIKEYELAKRYISSYLSVRERDPRAHRFLGQIYEAQDNTEEAVGCYKCAGS